MAEDRRDATASQRHRGFNKLDELLNVVRVLRTSPVPGAYRRFLRWQFASRILEAQMIVPWVGATRLVGESANAVATLVTAGHLVRVQ